jgi:hypothetical protein
MVAHGGYARGFDKAGFRGVGGGDHKGNLIILDAIS